MSKLRDFRRLLDFQGFLISKTAYPVARSWRRWAADASAPAVRLSSGMFDVTNTSFTLLPP
jgi:hypothetical protein